MSDIKENLQISAEVAPKLCLKCQKFFGNPQQLDFCSKCYKELDVQKPQQDIQENNKVQEKFPELKKIDFQQKDKSKCFACNKKVGHLGFECKCSDVFCKDHRMPEKHDCSFNFKEIYQRKLSENNPQIKSSPFEKI